MAQCSLCWPLGPLVELNARIFSKCMQYSTFIEFLINSYNTSFVMSDVFCILVG